MIPPLASLKEHLDGLTNVLTLAEMGLWYLRMARDTDEYQLFFFFFSPPFYGANGFLDLMVLCTV